MTICINLIVFIYEVKRNYYDLCHSLVNRAVLNFSVSDGIYANRRMGMKGELTIMITGKEDLLQSLIEVFIMEKGTKLFYSEAAGKATTPNVRKTFDELSHWEETHMDYIQYLYQSVNGDQEIMSFNEFRNRVGAHVAEGGIPVKDLEVKMGKYIVENEKGALTLAMEIEGKAFNLYHKLSLHSEDANAKVLFEEMMDQEVKHINYLKELKIKLTDANR